MMRRLLFALITAVVPAVAILAPGTANAAAATSAGCSGGIIAYLTFDPPSVPAGEASTLTTAAVNCTSQVLSGEATWIGQWTGLSSVIQAGCPAIKPVSTPFELAPGSASTILLVESTYAGCPATGLKVTVEFTVNGTVVGLASGVLTITHPTTPPR